MTIAEKLYASDPDTLFKIIVTYRLEDLCRLYFPQNLLKPRNGRRKIKHDPELEYKTLMMPSTYSGKTERKKGAIIQPHREVLK